MYVDIISKAKANSRKLDSLEMALVAGAPISKELVQDLQEILGIKKVYVSSNG
jgi:hypothetical protein